MKLITEPKVELVGRPILDPLAVMRFLEDNGHIWPEFQKHLDSEMDLGDRDGEWLAELAARNCYQSYGKGRNHEDHLAHIFSVGHFTVIEHITLNFAIWNVSRSLTHELVRHRLASYSQLSQRYVDESETDFVVPADIRFLEVTSPILYKKWIAHMQASVELYTELTDALMHKYASLPDKFEQRKTARHAARSVLPNATETKIFMSINIRSFRHFIGMRANPAAAKEIRALAVKMFRLAQNALPLLFADMKLINLGDGTQGVCSENHEV